LTSGLDHDWLKSAASQVVQIYINGIWISRHNGTSIRFLSRLFGTGDKSNRGASRAFQSCHGVDLVIKGGTIGVFRALRRTRNCLRGDEADVGAARDD
jgi:hypothetical protein